LKGKGGENIRLDDENTQASESTKIPLPRRESVVGGGGGERGIRKSETAKRESRKGVLKSC